MTNRIKLGIWLISTYFLAKSALLGIILVAVHVNPEYSDNGVKLILKLVPFIRNVHAKSYGVNFTLTCAFIVLGVSLGVGILLRKKWALAFVVCECGFPLLRLPLFIGLLMAIDPARLSSLISSSYFLFDLISSIGMVVFLLSYDLKKSFGF